jgi:hypothetical protein
MSEIQFRLDDVPSSVHPHVLPAEGTWTCNHAPVVQVLQYFVHCSWRNVYPLGYQAVIYEPAIRCPYPAGWARSIPLIFDCSPH